MNTHTPWRPGTAIVVLLAWVGLGAGAAFAQKPATPAQIEPKAIEALNEMGAYLRTLKSFAVRADTSIDEVLDSGQKIQFGGTVDYRVTRPDRLRADLATDLKQRQLFYDGKTLTVYSPRLKYYASVPASGTIGELLEAAAKKHNIDFPLADLFLWGTDKSSISDIKAATWVGPARCSGAACEHYAYRQQDVDWQIWIERGKQPLPRKLVITTTQEASQPQYIAHLTWNVTAKLDAKTFAFEPPKDAKRIVMTVPAQAGGKK